ncbi:MAG: response regulator [Cytophagales bacterium]|nr:response regulator [Cytophagales bacterium]
MTLLPVFVVDDNPMFARLLQVHLNNAGRFDVHVFPSGEKCLAYLHLQPRAVLLDYQLGGENALNGQQVLRVLLECPWHPKVIFMSNHQDKEQELLQSGVLAFIAKDKGAFSRLDAVLAAGFPGETNQPL